VTSRSLEILSTEECLSLLRSRLLGRVAVQLGEMPSILLVNYALLDGDVVFRTDPGSKPLAALMNVLFAFEVDEADPRTRSGWSVVVVGYSEQLRDRATLARVDELGLKPWVTEGRDFVVRIRTRTVTERRIPAL